MAEAEQKIDAFWHLFRRLQGQLALAKSADDSPYDELLEALQKVDAKLFLEYTNGGSPLEVIITAEGDRSVFPVARAVAAAAPKLDGWTVYALRPRVGFPTTVDWQAYVLDVTTIQFHPLKSGEGEGLGIRLLVPRLADRDLEDAHNAALRAIDHGLGEAEHAEAIQFTEIAPLAEGDEGIPLVELGRYVEWHRKKMDGAG